MAISKADVDRHFYEGASRALAEIGMSATEFFRQHPDRSEVGMAQILGRGASALGLIMKLFEEAHENSTVLELAKSLLYRRILDEYPDGWYYDEKIRTTVKLGGWYSDIAEYAPEYEDRALSIVRSLATTNAPELGWKPTGPEDERLRRVFEEYWSESE